MQCCHQWDQHAHPLLFPKNSIPQRRGWHIDRGCDYCLLAFREQWVIVARPFAPRPYVQTWYLDACMVKRQ